MTLTAYEQGVLAVHRQDYETARRLLTSAGDHPDALVLLGELAGEGFGGPADPAAKVALYERAASLGSATAAYNLGAIHAGAQRYALGLDWYRRAAELGDPAALHLAGIMVATGQGVTPDLAEADRLLRAAAAKEVPGAAFDLGTLHAYQRHDPVAAAEWFLLAAKQADPRAAHELELLVPRLREPADGATRARTMLGVILAFHLGDAAAAAGLLEVAAADGDAEAQRSLAFLLNEAGDRDRAAALFRAAADGGDGYAAHNLGVTATDPREAVHWLRRAAESGVDESYAHLANKLSELDLDEEALGWYVRGAEAGYPGCMFAAACWYRDGFGGPVDLVQALRWYLAMLGVGSGDGIHEAHAIVPMMTDDQIHEAGRLAGRIAEATVFVEARQTA